ncbi:hypothetical protein DRO55_00415 [Candidatus Bathyarchaeota archaeon]|nr:MAG: hypothetical protein DRO55_00415 [Candidatus Bathyarchaeota archaeon]
MSKGHKVRCEKVKAGLYTVTAENITVKVSSGIIPHFHFWYTEDNSTVYHVKFVQLAEFIDGNNDSAFQHNETVRPTDTGPGLFHTPIFSFSEGARGWNFSGFYNITSDEAILGVGFNFTLNGTRSPIFRDLYIELRCRIYLNDTRLNVTANDQAVYYNMTGGAELKVDVVIKNWPWLTDHSMLALRWDISWESGPKAGERHEPFIRGHRVDVSRNMTIERRIEAPPHANETSVVFRGVKTNRTRAHFDSLVKAKVFNGTAEGLVNVTASYRTDGEALRFYICYPYFGSNTLEHDPSMGVYPTTLEVLPVPSPNIPGIPADTVTYNHSKVVPKMFVGEVQANRMTVLLFRNVILTVNSSRCLRLNLTVSSRVVMHYLILDLKPGESLNLMMNMTVSTPEGVRKLDRDIGIYLDIRHNATLRVNATLRLYINKTALESELGRSINASRLSWVYWNGSSWILVPSWMDADGYLTAHVTHLSVWSIVEVVPLKVTAQLSPEVVTVGEPVTVSAVVKDEEGNPVADVRVTVRLGGKIVQLTDKGNGNYEGTIDTTGLAEGTYDIVIRAEKGGYTSHQTSKTVTVKMKEAMPLTSLVLYGCIAAVVIIVVVVILYKLRTRA